MAQKKIFFISILKNQTFFHNLKTQERLSEVILEGIRGGISGETNGYTCVNIPRKKSEKFQKKFPKNIFETISGSTHDEIVEGVRNRIPVRTSYPWNNF